jgi:hypothetical protein
MRSSKRNARILLGAPATSFRSVEPLAVSLRHFADAPLAEIMAIIV